MRMKTEKQNGKKSIVAEFSVICLVTGFLILFQIIWNFYAHEPYRKTDITMETVQTILQEGYAYESNPLTGEPYTAGAPKRWKILVLPYVYAFICKTTGVSPQVLLYELVPTVVLLLSYLVYSRFAVYLFPQNRKKQCFFMLLVAFLYQFGNTAAVTDSFCLFHAGFEGTSIRGAVLLPLALLLCLKEKWIWAAVCAAAEACIVWTNYGLGYTVLIMAVTALCKIAAHIWEKRRTTV